MSQLPKIAPLNPHIMGKIWGGSRLKQLGKLTPSNGEPIGETWEISDHPDGPSLFQDRPLSDWLGSPLSYLVKLIDTSDNLSVQVHPHEEYAVEHENSRGKTECWVILDAQPGAGIYLGLKEDCTKDSFQKALEAGEEMDQFLNFYPVSPGDFYFVRAGTAHAIGKGVFLAEVQQNSGVTYRVWDWNRVDKNGVGRELHIKKAMDVINFDPAFNSGEQFQLKKNLFRQKGKIELVDHPDFHLDIILLSPGESIELKPRQNGRPSGVLSLGAEFDLNGIILKSYRAALIVSGEPTQVSAGKASGGAFLYVS